MTTEMQVRDETPSVMTAAEFRAARDLLGLSGPRLAKLFGIDPRTLRRWEGPSDGPGSAVPTWAAEKLGDMRLDAFNRVADLINLMEAKARDGAPRPLWVVVPRDEEDMDAAGQRSGYPASWHRAVLERAAQQLTVQVRLGYRDEIPRGVVPLL